jgi:hypothetical protein
MSHFNLSADAPVFVPRMAPEMAAAAAPAPVPVADPTKTLTIDTKTLAGDRKRTLTMRPMPEVRKEKLEQPFDNIGTVYHGYDHSPDADSLPEDDDAVAIGCHDNDYRLKTIQRPMIGVEDVDVGDFPKNIQEYYWVNDGKKDEYPWYVLGGLGNGAYFYFAASCTFSGFACSGGMSLYAAKDLQTLYDHGMDGAARLRFASCFDKGTREKLKADAAAARAAQQAHIAVQRKAAAERAAAWKARKAAGVGASNSGGSRAAAIATATRISGVAPVVAGGGGGGRIARGPPSAAATKK